MFQKFIDIRILGDRNKVVLDILFTSIKEFDNSKLFFGGKSIFQRSKVVANQLYRLAGRLKIQKRIPKRHVQEFILPKPLFAMLYRPFTFVFRSNINFFGSAPSRLILFFIRFRQLFQIAFRIIFSLRNWANGISKASLLDIDKKQEIAIVQKIIFRSIYSRVKIYRRPIRKQSTFNNRYFTDIIAKPFRQQTRIVLNRTRERLINKPASRKRMIFHQNDNRVEARLFQARRIKNCKVKASSQFLRSDFVAGTNFLTDKFKALLRHGVMDIQLLQRSENSGHLLQHMIFAFPLVAAQRAITRPPFQLFRSTTQHLSHQRMIRSDKSGKQLRQHHITRPFVVSQQINIMHKAFVFDTVHRDHNFEKPSKPLRDAHEKIGIQMHVSDLRKRQPIVELCGIHLLPSTKTVNRIFRWR